MMTIQNKALPTPRKPLDLRRFLDDWVMLLAAIGIFVACTLLIDNFLSPLNMRGLGLAIYTTGIAACTMLYCLASGHFDLSVGSVIACAERRQITEIATLDRRHFGAVRPRHRSSFDLLP